jgi:hypothetical protein
MALPRSTVPGAVVKTTGQKFSGNTAIVVPTLAAGASVSVAVNVSSRKFAVGESTVAWFDIQDVPGGLVITSAGPVLGNKPTYTCTVTFMNPTVSSITGANHMVWIAQE